MTLTFLRLQFEAIRAACDAALDALSEMEPETCQHRNRTDMGSLARDHWVCQDCGYEFKEAADG